MPDPSSSSDAIALLSRAQRGSLSSLGKLMGLHSGYLRALVAQRLDGRLRVRVSPSDVLQETYADAHRDFERFRGKTPEEFRGWMRQILLNNLFAAVERHVQAAKRSVQREVSIEPRSPSGASAIRPAEPVWQGESPSAEVRREENDARLEAALAGLPEEYRQVIRWRHVDELPFAEIAERLDRSPGAARMLWLRAIKRLQQDLPGRSEL